MRFVFHQVDHLCAIAAITWGSCECSNIRGHAENAVHLLAMQNMLMISEEYSAGHRLSPFADCTRGCLGMNWIVTVACSDESDPSRMQKQPHGKIGRQFPMQPWSVGRSEGKNRKTIRIVLKHLFKGHKKGGQGGKEGPRFQARTVGVSGVREKQCHAIDESTLHPSYIKSTAVATTTRRQKQP